MKVNDKTAKDTNDVPAWETKKPSEAQSAKQQCQELNEAIDSALASMSAGLRKLRSVDECLKSLVRRTDSAGALCEYRRTGERLRRVTDKALGK